jgi:hypothetical protein
MIGYALSRARTYHQIEFLTAYLNRSEDMEDLKNGSICAKLFNIQLNPVKFRHSHNTYMFNKKTNTIFKGLTSIKGIGVKNDIGGQLLKFKDVKYNSFIDLLYDIKLNTSVGDSIITILIELDFFSEFGDANLLLQMQIIFINLHSKKQIKKDKLDVIGLEYNLIEKYSNKITEKLFKEIDIKALINHLIKKITFSKRTPVELLECEHEYYGYMQTTFNISDKFVIVYEIDLKYTPKLITYNLRTGDNKTYKIYKDNLYGSQTYDTPEQKQLINKYDVIKIIKTKKQNKRKKVGNDWIKIENEYEEIIKSYSIVR